MRPNLTSWSSKVIDCGTSTVGPIKYRYSATAPSVTALDALTVTELADGWPAGAVSKAAAIRSRKRRIWVSLNGVSIGTTPDFAIFGSQFSLIERWVAGARPGVSLWGTPVPAIVGNASYTPMQQAAGFGNNRLLGLRTSPSLARAYFSFLVGYDVGSGTIALDDCGYMTAEATLQGMNVAKHVGGSTVYTVRHAIADSSEKVVHYVCPCKSGLEGVRGMYFDWGYHASSLGNGNSALDVVLKRVLIEPGTASVVTLFVAAPVSALFATTGIAVYDPLISGHTLTLSSGFSVSRATAFDAYIIGGPSFMDAETYLGDVEVANGDVIVAATGVGLRWAGSVLDVNGMGLSDEDKASLTASKFKSFVSYTPRKLPTVAGEMLKKLSFYEDALDAGTPVENEIMIPADSGVKQMTFAEAEAKCLGANSTIAHQVFQSPTSLVYGKIALSGTATAIVANVSDSAGTYVAAPDEDLVVTSIYAGAALASSVVDMTLAAAFYSKYGVDIAALDDPTVSVFNDDADGFDETKLFYRTQCDYERLAPSVATAFQLMQYSVQRSTLSSFVVASMIEGKRAFKQLFA